ncbi:carboxylic ester hydrolase-like [Epargyreus clarus]|uniref:carboxylic ester hydrolase-like n=1 Tax=Epargyreus clarus TaxID=520877 RepID=UPI003C301C1E
MHVFGAVVVCTLACLTHAYHGGSHAGASQPPGDPVTVTPLGPIKGSWMTSRRGRRFESYRGVRYAQPPVGELRFQPPMPFNKYEDEVDAREEGPACPQPVTPGYYVDEDCLRLNVYTPKKNSAKPLPVVVFIHHGGFYVASGRSDVVGPHYLMDRDMVLVTINYRLASLGFISTGDANAPGNNGYKDQVAALRWVQQNIAAFGGDPACVTVTGYSAGSYSIGLHLLSPMSKGLFHRAISMSGSPFSHVEIGYDQFHLAKKQAELVGCPTTDSKAIMDCLKTIPWKTLGDSLSGFYEFAGDPVLVWTPVIEKDFGQERFLPRHPLEMLQDGELQSMPYIVSQTKNEFYWMAYNITNNATRIELMDKEWDKLASIAFLLPRDNPQPARVLRERFIGQGPLRNDSKTNAGLEVLYGDSLVGFPIHRLANLMSVHSKSPVYYYEFDYIGQHSFYEDPNTKKPAGVAHHDELIYLYTISALFPDIGLTGPDAKMVDRMTAIVYNFAKNGDPNPRGDLPEIKDLSWPPMVPSKRNYLQLGSTFSVHQNLFEERFRVWDELFPIDYNYKSGKKT